MSVEHATSVWALLLGRRTAALLLLVALAALGCAGPGESGVAPAPSPTGSRLQALTHAIARLDESVSPTDASRAAKEALRATAELAESYDMRRPALLHNALVNTGLRERGLCCHWAEDLIARLVGLDLETLEVHWVVARHGNYFREHSSALLLPRGRAFSDGLVLDGWRRAGELVWAVAAEDRYPWKIHPLDGQWSRLHCR